MNESPIDTAPGAAASAAVLAVHGLQVAARRRRRLQMLLRDVSLRVAAGEVHALVGESGAGKSLFVRTILGVAPPGVQVLGGRIDLLGHDWLDLADRARRAMLGRDVALIPQDPLTALNPAWRIGDQLGDCLARHLGLARAECSARVLHWLDAVRLADPARVARQYPHELSGGMRQRVLIAMAFCGEPRLILADEPTTALDVTVQREILMLLRRLQRDKGSAIVFVTHNLGIVARLCDQVTILHTGMVVEHGPVRDVFTSPRSPYTRALIGATPRHDRPAEALVPVDDAVNATLIHHARQFDIEYARTHRVHLAAPDGRHG